MKTIDCVTLSWNLPEGSRSMPTMTNKMQASGQWRLLVAGTRPAAAASARQQVGGRLAGGRGGQRHLATAQRQPAAAGRSNLLFKVKRLGEMSHVLKDPMHRDRRRVTSKTAKAMGLCI